MVLGRQRSTAQIPTGTAFGSGIAAQLTQRLVQHRTMANLLRRCYECGQPLGKKDIFCPRCGAKQPREKVAILRRAERRVPPINP